MGGESPALHLVEHLKRQGLREKSVIEAFIHVPRELFVSQELRHLAYKDEALPIREGQTISQPIVVATMTEALTVTPDHRVLEVGTGSGYQAAILGEMGATVVTIERIRSLASRARQLINHLGYDNVVVHHGDGTLGWADSAPFDRIIITAATPQIPALLVDQLRGGGRLVAPVGSLTEQQLLVAEKHSDGPLKLIELGSVRFVPLIGKGGWAANTSRG